MSLLNSNRTCCNAMKRLLIYIKSIKTLNSDKHEGIAYVDIVLRKIIVAYPYEIKLEKFDLNKCI